MPSREQNVERSVATGDAGSNAAGPEKSTTLQNLLLKLVMPPHLPTFFRTLVSMDVSIVYDSINKGRVEAGCFPRGGEHISGSILHQAII